MTKPAVQKINDLEPIHSVFHDTYRDGDNVSPVGVAASSGVAPVGQEILNILHTGPSVATISPVKVRELRQTRGNPFDYQSVTDVSRKDILIPVSGNTIPARVYRPSSIAGKISPALVYYHGGGFVVGSVDTYDKLVAQLAGQAGMVVISVDYRLAPEYPFPTPVYDTQRSFLWLMDMASSLQIDPNRMAIGGDSAGANLSAVVCMLNRDQSLPMPIFQLLIYPSTIGNNSTSSREEYSEGLLLTKEVLKWYHGHYIPDDQANDPRFNVLEADDHSGLPPAFVLTAGYDPLRDEGEAYADKLRASGNAVRHSCYTDMFHAFLSFGSLPQAQTALAECAQVLSAVLSGNMEKEL